MKPDTVHTLIGAYALDAVDELERAAVERHLAACQQCAEEVAELRETAARLAAAAAQPPPPGLRDQVLAQVTRTRQVASRSGPAAAARVSARWRRGTAAAVAACLLAVGGGFATWSVQQQQLNAERAQAQAAEQRAADARRREAAIAAVLAAPDAVVHDTTVAGGGRVAMVVSQAHNRAVVVLRGLRQVPADKAYQLWLIADAQPRSAAVLPAGAREATRLIVGLHDAELLGVTVEPAGGSQAPTTTPVAAINLA